MPTYIILHLFTSFSCSWHQAAFTHPDAKSISLAAQDSPSHYHGRLDHAQTWACQPTCYRGRLS